MPPKQEWKSYIELLRERGKQKRVTTEHQAVGLMLAEILDDEKHKALYMKIAKKYNVDFLMRVARDVAEREGVENKGAYFMKMLHQKIKEAKI